MNGDGRNPAGAKAESESAPAPGRAAASAAGQSGPDRALDQWRGLALLLVLISHGFFFTNRVDGIGRVGVNLFFFISGILVFRSLSRGPQGFWTGARYFWVRRTRRLVPAKYFYLFAMAALVLLVGQTVAPPDFRRSFFNSLPSSLLYYRNYYHGGIPGVRENLTGHLWSLGCEMQFYLLAPLLYFAGGRTFARRVIVWGLLLAALMAGGVIWRSNMEIKYTFQVAAWPMMAGFFAQYLRETFPRAATELATPCAWAGALSLAALTPVLLLAGKNAVVLTGTPLVAGCLGCYLLGFAPRGRLGGAFHYLGNRTYSMYLWQQPLTIGGLLPSWLHPFGSLLAVPLGALSFRYLEEPFMSKYHSLAKKPAAPPA